MNRLCFTLLLGVSFGLSSARACECLWLAIRENYRRADLVLRVHIVSIQDTLHYDLYSNPVRPPFTAGTRVVARVRRVYKGKMQDKVFSIKGMGNMCDYQFRRGEDYVVFLYKQDLDPQGQYVTSNCQRHFSLHNIEARQEFAHARQAAK
jgi:hypothetical protein